jgi:LysM repeat protein
VVQEGDTLAAIAERFGSTVSALQEANGIEDPDEIVIGQRLVIP